MFGVRGLLYGVISLHQTPNTKQRTQNNYVYRAFD